MVEEKYYELMNKLIDGESSPAEEEELRRYLDRNPEAQTAYRELLSLTENLNRTEEVEPPPALMSDIMSGIRKRSHPAPARYNGFIAYIGLIFSRNPVIRYGISFATGLLAGILILGVYSDLGTESVTKSDVYGTMLPGHVVSSLRDGAKFDIHSPGIAGSVVFQYTSDLIVGRIELHSEMPAELVLRFPPESLSVHALHHTLVSNPSIILDQSSLIISHTGDGIYTVFFSDSINYTGPVHVTLSAGGSQLAEKMLIIRERR